MTSHTLFPDLHRLSSVPPQGTTTRELLDDGAVRVRLLTFAPGAETNAAPVSHAVMVAVLSGRARAEVGDEAFAIGPGAWLEIKPHVAYSFTAIDALKLLVIEVQRYASGAGPTH